MKKQHYYIIPILAVSTNSGGLQGINCFISHQILLHVYLLKTVFLSLFSESRLIKIKSYYPHLLAALLEHYNKEPSIYSPILKRPQESMVYLYCFCFLISNQNQELVKMTAINIFNPLFFNFTCKFCVLYSLCISSPSVMQQIIFSFHFHLTQHVSALHGHLQVSESVKTATLHQCALKLQTLQSIYYYKII
jgi:hypothetical protein